MVSALPAMSQLVDAEGLLAALFDEKCRPKLLWVRERQRDRSIPYIKVGRRVFFDVEEVRNALHARHTIKARICR
jgi:hypothetical protein